MSKWLLALLLILGASPGKNELVGRAYPVLSVSDPALGGCSNVLLSVQIRGPETEAWYCPKVEWEFPNETESFEESDCDPYEERSYYPRRWSKAVCAGPGTWVVIVKLSKAGKRVARTEITFYVKG